MHAIPREHPALSVTRRRFLRSGAMTAAIVPALSAWDLSAAVADAPTPSSFAPNADLLRSAKSTAEWIRSVQKHDERGVWWLPDPDHPEKLTTVSASNAIYSGSAGTVLFFIQLAGATADTKYLDTAAQGADFLAATWRDSFDKPAVGLLSLPGLNLSLYNGLSGIAFVLNEIGKATKNVRYSEAAKSATDAIVEAARPAGSGVAWSGSPGVAADGSIILYLLYAADQFDNDQYRAVAKKAGDRAGCQRTAWRTQLAGVPGISGTAERCLLPELRGRNRRRGLRSDPPLCRDERQEVFGCSPAGRTAPRNDCYTPWKRGADPISLSRSHRFVLFGFLPWTRRNRAYLLRVAPNHGGYRLSTVDRPTGTRSHSKRNSGEPDSGLLERRLPVLRFSGGHRPFPRALGGLRALRLSRVCPTRSRTARESCHKPRWQGGSLVPGMDARETMGGHCRDRILDWSIRRWNRPAACTSCRTGQVQRDPSTR